MAFASHDNSEVSPTLAPLAEDHAVVQRRATAALLRSRQIARPGFPVITDKMEAQMRKAVASRKPKVHQVAGSGSRIEALALRLHRRGITRVRPLEGGLDGWVARNLPVAEVTRAAVQR